MNLTTILMVICILEGNPSGEPRDHNTTFGEFCISRSVIRDYNKRYHTHVTPEMVLDNGDLSEQVALDQLLWLQKKLGLQATPRTVAAAWNAGLRGYRLGRGREYGSRAEALYLEMSTSKVGSP